MNLVIGKNKFYFVLELILLPFTSSIKEYMNKINIHHYNSPFGELILGDFEGKLCLCDWFYRKRRIRIDDRIKSHLNAEYEENKTDLLVQTENQLEEYFKGKRKEFNLPIKLAGTDFQIKVWNALQQIPYGKTETYLGLSKLLDNEKAIRAVAGANGANAISIIIPCHRIIGSDNKPIGYAGGINIKRKLLKLEGSLPGNQLELF